MAVSRAEKRLIEPWWQPVNLSGLHTKVLLNLLGYARRLRSDIVPMPDGTDLSVHYIRAELAKREHIPDRIEARALDNWPRGVRIGGGRSGATGGESRRPNKRFQRTRCAGR